MTTSRWRRMARSAAPGLAADRSRPGWRGARRASRPCGRARAGAGGARGRGACAARPSVSATRSSRRPSVSSRWKATSSSQEAVVVRRRRSPPPGSAGCAPAPRATSARQAARGLGGDLGLDRAARHHPLQHVVEPDARRRRSPSAARSAPAPRRRAGGSRWSPAAARRRSAGRAPALSIAAPGGSSPRMIACFSARWTWSAFDSRVAGAGAVGAAAEGFAVRPSVSRSPSGGRRSRRAA